MATDLDTLSNKFLRYLRDQLDHPLVDFASPVQPLQGGFETQIFRFQLNNVPEDFSKPLVLRLYPEFYGTGNAIWESAIQKVLAAEGYPAADVHLVCTDMSVLGGVHHR